MSRLRLRQAELAWLEVQDEVLALDGRSLVYLSTNLAGARLWNRLAHGATHEELAQCLVNEFQIDPERARQDVNTFVASLAENGLLEAE